MVLVTFFQSSFLVPCGELIAGRGDKSGYRETSWRAITQVQGRDNGNCGYDTNRDGKKWGKCLDLRYVLEGKLTGFADGLCEECGGKKESRTIPRCLAWVTGWMVVRFDAVEETGVEVGCILFEMLIRHWCDGITWITKVSVEVDVIWLSLADRRFESHVTGWNH